jgi:hypothetical protein
MTFERAYTLCYSCYKYNTPLYMKADQDASESARLEVKGALTSELRSHKDRPKATQPVPTLIETAKEMCADCDKSEPKLVELIEKDVFGRWR